MRASGHGNLCGGCARLAGAPAAPCEGSVPGSIWVCTAADSVECLGAADQNACGGIGPLDLDGLEVVPGAACDAPCGVGRVVCDPIDQIALCAGPGTNTCGGCGALPGAPLGTCGCDDAGTYVCDDDSGALVCDGAPTNACGGCGTLAVAPGTACGVDGVQVCESRNATACVARDGEANACGGTVEVAHRPNSPCGACDSGAYVCTGPDELSCEGDLDCGDGNRACVEGAGSVDASCGDCLPAYVDRAGACVAAECDGEEGCTAVLRDWSECDWADVCDEASARTRSVTPVSCVDRACVAGAEEIEREDCAPRDTDGLACTAGLCVASTCVARPDVPTGVSATTTREPDVRLAWTAVVRATGYEIEIDGSDTWASAGAGTAYTDTSASPVRLAPAPSDVSG